ncbi:endonuclease V [Deinococcus aetherius]|uniref:Endonuclease V n=1 Tax=Deinococcus aetherius TaxID=200252 RepID=A0ABM8A9P4_9DEIO|nr:endonuclease V [Deinococcus aetherius]BDP40479.1 endonuclease V [Deinococcus aetherius]
MCALILAVDVGYSPGGAKAAGILFGDWADEHPERVLTAHLGLPEEYLPGEFYRRELPALLKIIEPALPETSVIVIDGYVWLGSEQRPGLGLHLWEVLEERVAVIGVAKSRFHGTPEEAEVLRGTSRSPLFVTSVGLPLEEAKGCVLGMAGEHRIPTLLRYVDRLSRSG